MKRVIDFLKKHNVTTVATCSDNKPRASVVEYYFVNEAIIIATNPGSIKAHNLKHNNRISMSVHDMPLFVTIDGVVTTPTKAEIDGYNKTLFDYHPEFKEMAEKGMIPPLLYFKIVPETAYYNDFSNGRAPAEIIKA